MSPARHRALTLLLLTICLGVWAAPPGPGGLVGLALLVGGSVCTCLAVALLGTVRGDLLAGLGLGLMCGWTAVALLEAL